MSSISLKNEPQIYNIKTKPQKQVYPTPNKFNLGAPSGPGYPFQVLAGFRPEVSGLQPAVGFPLLSLAQTS